MADQTAPSGSTAPPQPQDSGSVPSGIRVEMCDVVDTTLVGAFARLHPQLSSSPPPDAAALERIVGHPASTLLIARTVPDGTADGMPGENVGAMHDADAVVGAMILVLFPLASGLRAWIEDVVVDESVRGRGIGAALNRHAIEIARRAGARTVDLTSRPDREAANRLYARLGFNRRSTNVYRLDL